LIVDMTNKILNRVGLTAIPLKTYQDLKNKRDFFRWIMSMQPDYFIFMSYSNWLKVCPVMWLNAVWGMAGVF
jgi:hypothetical protein